MKDSDGREYAKLANLAPGDLVEVDEGAPLMRLHPSITAERVLDACERRARSLDNPGFCVACGEDHEGCEPDARGYYCEFCGEDAVFGAEELIELVA